MSTATTHDDHHDAHHHHGAALLHHADGLGDTDDNQLISERRAQAVMTYLVEQGAPTDALSAEGRGSAEPLASNRTAVGRNRNRRVAIERYSPGP